MRPTPPAAPAALAPWPVADLAAGGALMMSFADQVITRRAALDDRHRPWQPRTLAAMLDSVAGQYPDRPFVITEQGTLSYAELAGWSARLARGLAVSGVRPGDHRRDGE